MKKLNTHLTRNGVLVGNTSPVNTVTPQFIGQHYIQENGDVYIAYGVNPNQWNNLQSDKPLTLSTSTYDEMIDLPLEGLRNGTICYVEELSIYYRLINDKWEIDRNYVLQDEEPTDKNVIWFTPSGTVKQPSQSKVTIEELVASISVLVSKISGLEKRIYDLEHEGEEEEDTPVEDETEENAILLEDGGVLSLEDGGAFKLENTTLI